MPISKLCFSIKLSSVILLAATRHYWLWIARTWIWMCNQDASRDNTVDREHCALTKTPVTPSSIILALHTWFDPWGLLNEHYFATKNDSYNVWALCQYIPVPPLFKIVDSKIKYIIYIKENWLITGYRRVIITNFNAYKL